MGIDLNQYISGDYLCSKDLELSKEWVIKGFSEVVYDEKRKAQMDLEHKGTSKTLTLNVTNTKRLIECFGAKTDESLGKIVVLKIIEGEYKGEVFEGIRIDVEATKKANKNE